MAIFFKIAYSTWQRRKINVEGIFANEKFLSINYQLMNKLRTK